MSTKPQYRVRFQRVRRDGSLDKWQYWYYRSPQKAPERAAVRVLALLEDSANERFILAAERGLVYGKWRSLGAYEHRPTAHDDPAPGLRAIALALRHDGLARRLGYADWADMRRSTKARKR